MGRKKKRKNNGLKNVGLGALVATLGIFGYLNYIDGNLNFNFKLPSMDIFYKHKNEARIENPIIPQEPVKLIKEETKLAQKSLPQVKLYFIGHNNDKAVYRTVYRVNNTNVSNIEYAVRCLLQGPTNYEKGNGIYSEIPPTKLLSVVETQSKVIINVSDSFGNGGGADSLYKRMYQLIKTVNTNTDKPVYLQINGRMVETLGGEGLMLKQPLNGSSLDD